MPTKRKLRHPAARPWCRCFTYTFRHWDVRGVEKQRYLAWSGRGSSAMHQSKNWSLDFASVSRCLRHFQATASSLQSKSFKRRSLSMYADLQGELTYRLQHRSLPVVYSCLSYEAKILSLKLKVVSYKTYNLNVRTYSCCLCPIWISALSEQMEVVLDIQ